MLASNPAADAFKIAPVPNLYQASLGDKARWKISVRAPRDTVDRHLSGDHSVVDTT
jgi:hypothetical protein